MNDINKQFDYEVVSPDKKFIEDKAYQIVVPADEGDFGVLIDHSAVVSSLRAGVVSIYQDQDTDIPQKIFVTGGFVDVTSTNCKILADNVINLEDMDQSEIEKEIQNLVEDLGLAEGEHDIAKVEAKLALEKAKLSAVTGKYI